MDTILSQLAQARKDAIKRNENFVRLPMELLADVVVAIVAGNEQKKPTAKKGVQS